MIKMMMIITTIIKEGFSQVTYVHTFDGKTFHPQDAPDQNNITGNWIRREKAILAFRSNYIIIRSKG